MAMMSRLLLTYLANSLWMTCITTGTAIVFSKLLRRAPATYTHMMWVAALVITSFLPLASLPDANHDHDAATALTQAAGNQSLSSKAAPMAGLPQKSKFSWQHLTRSFPLTPFLSWALAACYTTFVFYRGARLGWAWKQTSKIRCAACPHPLPENLAAVTARCFALLRVRPVDILFSSAIQSPLTLGVRRPVLIVPKPFCTQYSEGDLASAFCHEVAHIRRHDFLLNLIYEAVLLPLSYHPLAVLLKTRVDQSRELACDEAAAKLSTREAYARSLLNIAQSVGACPSAAASGYALGLFDTNTLEERIMILLDGKNRLSKNWGRVLAAGAMGCLALVSLGISAFSLQPAQSAASPTNRQETQTGTRPVARQAILPACASANDTQGGPHVRVAEITFTASTIDKTEMDLDAFARQIEALSNLRPECWLEEVKERTSGFWLSHGFFKVQVDADSKLLSATGDEQAFSVTARVDAGAQYHLKKLEFLGAKAFTTSELEAMMPIQPGEIFHTGQIKKGLETMRAAYVSRGYKQFTPIPHTIVDDSDHTITLKFNMEEGPQSK